jgi:hypothetical protein
MFAQESAVGFQTLVAKNKTNTIELQNPAIYCHNHGDIITYVRENNEM